jgi:hypothetical protein
MSPWSSLTRLSPISAPAHKALAEEAARLEQLQPVRATPHWRKDRHGQPRYLYLIHPTQDDGSRQREYIGADPDKQAEALYTQSAVAKTQNPYLTTALKSAILGVSRRTIYHCTIFRQKE